jgi:hypothetical protein
LAVLNPEEKLVRKTIFVVVLLAVSPLLFAQQALNNDAVIKLVKAGLGDDLIVTTVSASAGSYDISADGLIALKNAGVSDKVVAAIVSKASAPVPAAAPAAAAMSAPVPPDPDDPAAPHDPGVYLLTTSADGKQKMLFIDRAGAGGEKMHRGFASASMAAQIPGAHASARSVDGKPVFYMYFPSTTENGGLGGAGLITSPSQFSLLTLDVKKDHRETAVAKISGFGSMSMGNDSKKTSLIDTVRVRSGVYKVSPSESLKPAEYAFIASTNAAGAAGGTVVIYDFGIDSK